jgi:hypothetical protein
MPDEKLRADAIFAPAAKKKIVDDDSIDQGSGFMLKARHAAWLLVCMLLFTGNLSATAQDFTRFELQPFGGFVVSGAIPLVSDDDARRGAVHVDSSFNGGMTFAVNLNALDAIEGMWQRQFTRARLPEEITLPVIPGKFDLSIDRIHCNFLHHYEVAGFDGKPYIMAGLGATVYRAGYDGQRDTKSHFSFALGGGLKYFFTGRFGLRFEVRWSPTLLSAHDSDFWCRVGADGGACEVKFRAALQQQLDMTTGLVFRF